MYKYILIFSLIALSSCSGMKTEKPVTEVPNPTTETPSEVPATPVAATNPTVSLNYTLREGSPTGNILETTVESVAVANGLYKTGAAYSPFEVVLGTNSVIPGFENGIAGMKKGEKKTIEVLPKDGYGEAAMTRTVSKGEIAEVFTITTDASRFQDKIVETIQKNMLGEQGQNIAVGQTLTGGSNVVATVTKIEGDSVTLTIDNKENPFYGKTLAVGEKADKDNITFTITALTDSGITLDIVNKNSPFAGKEFVVGATATLPTNELGVPGGEMKIISINGDVVEVSLPNSHPLAGKTLYFEVEVLDIK